MRAHESLNCSLAYLFTLYLCLGYPLQICPHVGLPAFMLQCFFAFPLLLV